MSKRLHIIFASSSGRLAVFEDEGRRLIQTTARIVREAFFPAFLNRDYLFQRTDPNMNVCHFVGMRDEPNNDAPGNSGDVIHLTYAASLVTQPQGGVLVISDGSIATWRGLIHLLTHSSASLSIINFEVMKPSPVFSTGANRF